MMLVTLQSNAANCSPEQINDFNQKVIQIQYSLEGLNWCIQNFANFQTHTTLLFAFRTFQFWISKENWESLNPQIIEFFKQALFETVIPIFDSFPESVKSVLSVTQIHFALNLYPNSWPDFWQNLLTLPVPISINFLSQFVSIVTELENCQQLFFQMQMDDSETNVVNFVIQCLTQGVTQAYSILTQMLEWIDPTPVIQNPSVINQIKIGLSSPDGIVDSIKLLTGITQSSIDPETLLSFLNEFNIIPTMMEICQNSPVDVMGYASGLIAACATISLETPAAPDYYQISLLLLGHPQVNVAETIIRFVGDFTEMHPEFTPRTFEALTNRLALYFDSSPTEIDSFASDLLKKINNLISRNNGLLDAYVDSVLNIPNIEKPSILSALFNIILDARDAFKNATRIDEIISRFKYLLQIPPPLDIYNYYATTAYMIILYRIIPNNPDPAIYEIMFNSLMGHLMTQYEDFQIEKFISILSDFIKSGSHSNSGERIRFDFVTVTPEHILSLVNTNNFDLITIASKLMCRFDDQTRVNLFQHCMKLMLGIFQTADDKTKVIHLMLLMIQNQINSSGSQDISFVVPFINEIIPVAGSHGETMALLLQTIHKVLKNDGLQLFLQCINQIKEMEGLAEMCNVANLYIQNSPDKSWINELMGKILQLLDPLINSVHDICDNSEETKEASRLLDKFYEFAAHGSPFLSLELNTQLLLFTGKYIPILLTMINIDPLKASIEYISSLSSSPLYQILLTQFLPLTFQIIISPNFTIQLGKWRHLIVAISTFHQNLTRANHDATLQQISAFFQQYNTELSKNACAVYITCLESPNISQHSSEVNQVFEFIHQANNGI
ncbi:hypothetical protein TRFO_28005 [Tritrichomonas foetus]|uniref:Exportin-T n=1 Tax=Tritrichomonas foetus TaxID=1144522 RepID=A0A1J4JZ92_9EUKA|nr:hypothetical protein TRFO_28005 [Tritrichomonas foetus]|eukprot:OHT04495.1 hypothetical protein TRFO_28005 [Tritrichomonas foetus]